jgi:hypothetical protein
LTIFGKNSAKNRKKTPFFHEKCIFFAFFCKKNTRGYDPFFCKLAPRKFSTSNASSGVDRKFNRKKKSFFFSPRQKIFFKIFLRKFFFFIKKKFSLICIIFEMIIGGWSTLLSILDNFPEDCTKRHSELAERSETFHNHIQNHYNKSILSTINPA